MSKQRKFVLIAAVIGIIGIFLPWISLGMFGSVNGMHGWGVLVFLGFVGAGAVCLIGDQTKTLDKTFWFVALACAAISSIIMLILFFDAISYLSVFSFGFWITLLAALATLGAAYMFRSPTDSIKSGFDSLKDDINKKANQGGNTGSGTGTV